MLLYSGKQVWNLYFDNEGFITATEFLSAISHADHDYTYIYIHKFHYVLFLVYLSAYLP